MERTKKIKITYILFSITVFVLSLIYANLNQVIPLMDEKNDIIFSKLQFDHSELVTNLFNGDGFYQFRYGVKYYLAKMPILPLLISGLALISKNLYFIYIVKNLILFSILFFSLNFYCEKHSKSYFFFLIYLICIFAIPHNLHVQLNIHFADTIVACLMPSLFLLLSTENKRKYIYISLILFFLYLTKTSMFFLCLIIPFIILILENDKISLKIIPIFAVILSISVWGSFGYFKTGIFPFGSKILSVSSEGMNIALNKEFNKYYPKKSVDLIKYEKPNKRYENEWEIYEFYKEKNKIYIRNNLGRYAKDTLIKINFIFFNIHKDAAFPDKNGEYYNPLKISYLINKLFFNLSLIISLFVIIKNISKISNLKREIYFLSIVSLNLFPLVVGWATAKHLTGLTIVCIIYSFTFFFNTIKMNKNL